jgi:Cysteine-rich secretory protein family
MKLSSSILGWPLLYSYFTFAHTTPNKRDASVVTVYIPAPTSPPSASFTVPSALIGSTLNSTNHFRDQHNARPLTWNTSLAEAASSWGSQCQWQHSGGPTGENLALGYLDMTTAIDAWGKERARYDFKAPTGFSEETGHFTQLVWKETTSVGCAAVDCSGKNGLKGYVTVCEYWPAGNVVGQQNAYFRANVQAQIHEEPPVPRSSILPSQVSLSPTTRSTHTTTATLIEATTNINYMATKTNAKTTAWALGNEAAADQLKAGSRGRWAIGVTVAALVIAGAIG